MRIKPRKRLFLGLLLACEIFIAAALFLLWFIPSRAYENWGTGLSVAMGWAMVGVLALFSLAMFLLVTVILLGREVPGTKGLRGALIRYLLPVITAIGGIFRIPKDDIRKSFIEINNELVRSEAFHRNPKRVLILMPHCVQKDSCPYRITVDVKNCRKCGKCDFSELTAIAQRLGVEMTVATGGTLARRVVVEVRPDLIVGVACERDLSAGISDTYPIPVLGVLIDRPEGPCLNTRVNVQKVQEALTAFLPSSAREKEPHRAGT